MAAASVPAFKFGSKIVAVAKNYVAHAKEMGVKDVSSLPKTPSYFLKPGSSVIFPGAPIVIPPGIGSVHHELELGVVINETCSHVEESKAMDVVGGYCLALDMTARELQTAAKAEGQPWTRSKCYDTFTPMTEPFAASTIADPSDLELWLKIDGVEKQRGTTADMIFTIPQMIATISSVMTLNAGDIIITGTPEGVGPVEAGQTITAGITGVTDMEFPVVDFPGK